MCGTEDAVQYLQVDGPGWTIEVRGEAAQVEADGSVVVWAADGSVVVLRGADGHILDRWPQTLGDWTTRSGARLIWTPTGPLHARPLEASGCEGEILVAEVHPDGRVAALCTSGQLLVVPPEGPKVHRAPTEAVGDHVGASLAWLGEHTVVIGTLRGQLLVVDVHTGATRRRVHTSLDAIATLAADPHRGFVAASGMRGGVALWQADSGALIAELPADRPRSLAFSPEGLVVADGARRTWRLPDPVPTVVSGEAGWSQVSVARDTAATIVAVGAAGQVLTVNPLSGHVERRPFGTAVVKAGLVSGGDLLATGMNGSLLGVWENDHWQAIVGARPLRRVDRLTDGTLLGIDMDDGIYAWSSLTASPAHWLPGQRFVDLATAGENALVLDTTGTLVSLTATGPGATRSVPDARSVALSATCDAVATLDTVDLRCGPRQLTLQGDGERLLDIALSPDERWLAAGTLEGRIRVWDTTTGTLTGWLPGHGERVVSVAFLPDGDLVSASWDHTVRLWDLDALDAPLLAPR